MTPLTLSASDADGRSFSSVAAGIVPPVEAVVLAGTGELDGDIRVGASDSPTFEDAADGGAIRIDTGAGTDLLDEGEVRQFRRVATGWDKWRAVPDITTFQ